MTNESIPLVANTHWKVFVICIIMVSLATVIANNKGPAGGGGDNDCWSI